MRVSYTSWALLSTAVWTFVRTSLAEHVFHERAVESPEEWVKLGNINRNGLLPVRIGLAQQNLDQGHELLMERSNPDSPKYGQHMTQQEVTDLFAPHNDSVDAVHSWLEAEGIKLDRVSQSTNRQWIQFHATVEELENLLHTTYDVYENNRTGARKVGADEYSIPAELVDHVDYIIPAATRLQGRREVDPPSAHDAIPPASALLDYDGNELGLYELQPYNQTSLSLFFENFSPNIPAGTTPLFALIDGALRFSNNETEFTTGDGEAMLDLTTAYPIIYPQQIRLFNVDDTYWQVNITQGYFNTFLDALDGSYCNRAAFNITGDSPEFDPTYPDPHGYMGQRMCGLFKPTNVISISYSPEEQLRTVNYDRRQCSEWMKLSLQGVTIVGATGDNGVAGNGADCIKGPDGQNDIFNPLTLTNCPYVLAVGSTELAPHLSPSPGHEIATTQFPSSGGFSNIYPAPEWQKSAIDKYFDENPTPYKYYETEWGENIGAGGGIFNRAGRGFPDISAYGWNIVTVRENFLFLGGGTSSAAPIVASILTRINEERLSVGKSTVGFVNPAVYANPSILHDVTVGNSSGCGTPGFLAAKGWDPVTGLGTPDYPKMLEYFMSLGSN
ncbi:peptidase S8/S53 domain-containing protein [Xylogone sp. PMI_703]|nr:peptidase S8/S53 domain-containing protein [Xylogone sp. PMI_703]